MDTPKRTRGRLTLSVKVDLDDLSKRATSKQKKVKVELDTQDKLHDSDAIVAVEENKDESVKDTATSNELLDKITALADAQKEKVQSSALNNDLNNKDATPSPVKGDSVKDAIKEVDDTAESSYNSVASKTKDKWDKLSDNSNVSKKKIALEKEKNLKRNFTQELYEELSPVKEEVASTTSVSPVVAPTYTRRSPGKWKNSRRKKTTSLANKIYRKVEISGEISISKLASLLSEKSRSVIKIANNYTPNCKENTIIESDIAVLLAEELGHKATAVDSSPENKLLRKGEIDDYKDVAPIVTIMGHVDHGKTTLLDNLRKSNIAAKEAGKITQAIGSYRVLVKDGRWVTFLDTPGHAAFSGMRLRGVSVTDIVVIVVAADDGVKTQTIEAIKYAVEAGVPIVVAVNKIDSKNADPTTVTSELIQHNIVPEEYGGEVPMVLISALTGENLPDLIETILLQAEIMELKANYSGCAEGVVVESHRDKYLGVYANIIVKNGILKKSDLIISNNTTGKIKAIYDDLGNVIKEATPGMPVNITGLDAPLQAGSPINVVKSEKDLKELLRFREKKTQIDLNKAELEKEFSFDDFFSQDKEKKYLNLILKADSYGSLEALEHVIQEQNKEENFFVIIDKKVGDLNESDLNLVKSLDSDSVVVLFNSKVERNIKNSCEKDAIRLVSSNIIYKLLDELNLIKREIVGEKLIEKKVGDAEVRQVFSISNAGKIAGVYVKSGVINRTSYIKVIRDGETLECQKIKALKRFKEDVKEVGTNFECGLSLEGFSDFEVGDKLEVVVFVPEE